MHNVIGVRQLLYQVNDQTRVSQKYAIVIRAVQSKFSQNNDNEWVL